jgi:RNA-binding protein 39
MQLSRKCTERDLTEFLEETTGGRIVSCRMIKDRHTGRPKGIAYAEFEEQETVIKALALTGQRLLRAPIVVMLTQSEKNRQAAEKARLEKEALTRLSVLGLPSQMTEDKHLAIAFEPFGKLRECRVLKDEDGNSSGEGIVVYDSPADAQKALEGMNDKTFLGSVLSVSLAAPPGTAAGLSQALAPAAGGGYGVSGAWPVDGWRRGEGEGGYGVAQKLPRLVACADCPSPTFSLSLSRPT